jgi:hypothetical protein
MMEPVVAALCPHVELQPPTFLPASRPTSYHQMKLDRTPAEPSFAKARMSDTRAWYVAQAHLPIRHPA